MEATRHHVSAYYDMIAWLWHDKEPVKQQMLYAMAIDNN